MYSYLSFPQLGKKKAHDKRWQINPLVINAIYKTKILFLTLLPTQHYSFFRNGSPHSVESLIKVFETLIISWLIIQATFDKQNLKVVKNLFS